MSNHIPNHLFYSADHEWLRADGTEATIGITAYAAGQLGDIVFVEVAPLGTHLAKGAVFGTIEAVKTVSELFMPVSGTVTAINSLVMHAPERINTEPYADGWLARISIDQQAELGGLLDAAGYALLIG